MKLNPNPVILFRQDWTTKDELAVAKKYFPVVEKRTDCYNDWRCPFILVIGRYSVLPFYRELYEDLDNQFCSLANTVQQHNWIADFEYYEQLKDYTPETWTELSQTTYQGPFVVKGKTNSRKYSWNKSMYAPTRLDAINVASELCNDSLIGTQEIIYRKYIPLVTYEYGLHGLPFTNEWRFFFWREQLLSYGYYWSSAEPETIEKAKLTTVGITFAKGIAKLCAQYANFFVLDIAEKDTGGWILIEVNDGQMSGLSENNPDKLYNNLAEVLNYEK